MNKESCKINADFASYYLPIDGGKTLPVIFDFSSCVPVNNIQLIPVLPSEVLVNQELNFNTLNSVTAAAEKRITISFRHNNQTNVVPGTLKNISFTVNGTDAPYFATPE